MPVYGPVPVKSMISFMAIADAGTFSIVEGTWIDWARNKIMMDFEEEDFLLMLDSDMVFDPDDASRLFAALRAHPECGAISGHYMVRAGTGLPACDWHHPDDPENWIGEDDRKELAEKHTKAGALTYVDSFGGGFLGITQEAKQKVGNPWFKTYYKDNGDFVGEDTYFCKRLQEEGFRPAVHFGIRIGHCGERIYRP